MGVKGWKHKGMPRCLAVGLLTILLSASLITTGFAGELEDAVRAEIAKDIRKTAEQGNDKSQLQLGIMYIEGHGVPQDYAEAAKWFRMAAEQGNDDAQSGLGILYTNGNGVPQDYAEAVKWYRRAAEQGNAMAQYNLAYMYASGQGVPQDYVMAHMWFNLSASRFSATKRDNSVKNRDLVASKMTPEQIAEAQRLAREWKPKKEGK